MSEEDLSAIQFYIPKYQKLAFKRACFMRDSTMSREFRKFIFEFCKDCEEPRNDIYLRLLTDHQRQSVTPKNT
jgi:hypothetical protein